MTVKDWCEAQGISVKTFYYRLRVLRKRQIKLAYKIKQILSIIEYSNKIEKSEDIYEVGYR